MAESQDGFEMERRLELFPGILPRKVIHEFGPWLAPELIATEAARQRLQKWASVGAPDVDASELVGQAFGAMPILQQARSVLASLPPFIKWYISSYCFIVCVGRDALAWCAKAPIVIAARLIALSGDVTDDTVLHEYAHGVLHGADDEPQTILSIGGIEKIRAAPEIAARELGVNDKLAEHAKRSAERRAREECQADALARVWRAYRENPKIDTEAP